MAEEHCNDDDTSTSKLHITVLLNISLRICFNQDFLFPSLFTVAAFFFFGLVI